LVTTRFPPFGFLLAAICGNGAQRVHFRQPWATAGAVFRVAWWHHGADLASVASRRRRGIRAASAVLVPDSGLLFSSFPPVNQHVGDVENNHAGLPSCDCKADGGQTRSNTYRASRAVLQHSNERQHRGQPADDAYQPKDKSGESPSG